MIIEKSIGAVAGNKLPVKATIMLVKRSSLSEMQAGSYFQKKNGSVNKKGLP
jgi:hypothetical protein